MHLFHMQSIHEQISFGYTSIDYKWIKHSPINAIVVMTSNKTNSASYIIRHLPRSVNPYKWMFGLEVVLGLKPFDTILRVPNSGKADIKKSHRPLIVSAISCWGMLFYLVHCIVYATSIVVWQFTDIFSLYEQAIGLMRTQLNLVHTMVAMMFYVLFNSKYIGQFRTILLNFKLCFYSNNVYKSALLARRSQSHGKSHAGS